MKKFSLLILMVFTALTLKANGGNLNDPTSNAFMEYYLNATFANEIFRFFACIAFFVVGRGTTRGLILAEAKEGQGPVSRKLRIVLSAIFSFVCVNSIFGNESPIILCVTFIYTGILLYFLTNLGGVIIGLIASFGNQKPTESA